MSRATPLKMEPKVGLSSGGYLDVLNPLPEHIHIEDIAHGLSHLCRFNGQCREFYSVAQHSVRVSQHVPRELAMWGLLHDAAEAYLGDIVSPVKQLIPKFADLEMGVSTAIYRKFGVEVWDGLSIECIRTADLAALRSEQLHFMPNQAGDDWGLNHLRAMPFQAAETSAVARARFLSRFKELSK